MDVTQIAELLEKFDQSKSVYMELKAADFSMKLKKEEACQTAAIPPMPQIAPQPMQAMAFAPQAATVAQSAPEAAEQAANSAAEEEDYIKAPLVGVFYAAPSPDKAPFVEVGKKVQKGETVCLIEAMKMMSEVTAPKDGTITKILVENGDFIEFDQPLFAIQE